MSAHRGTLVAAAYLLETTTKAAAQGVSLCSVGVEPDGSQLAGVPHGGECLRQVARIEVGQGAFDEELHGSPRDDLSAPHPQARKVAPLEEPVDEVVRHPQDGRGVCN